MKNYYAKFLIIGLIGFFLIGCITVATRHYYTPKSAPNWRRIGGRSYQFKCNNGEVEIAPIVLSTTEVKTQEKPWIYVNFRSTKRIENCDLSFVTLKNKVSGERVAPINAKTNVLNDDHLEKKTTYCYYYFDIKEEEGAEYNLCISDEVFGCKVEPVPYRYEKATDWEPVQF